ncbi:hypothetical protein [Prevotella intermedia]|uniref:hypothetical protein n=1 Tax=Prevotella intermedia TaxID=28131 RepID=UPI00077DF9C1
MQLLHNYLYINALQNLLFCVPKAAVLHGKSVGFASQNSRFRNAKAQLYKAESKSLHSFINVVPSFNKPQE